MNVIFKTVLNVLKTMLLKLMGEKLIAYMAFSFLTYLASLTKTNIDNDVVVKWKAAYYDEPDPLDANY